MRATLQMVRTLLITICLLAALGSVSPFWGRAFFGNAPHASQPQPTQRPAMQASANPAQARFGPRLRVETSSLPNFAWKAARMAGTAAFFVPNISAVKSATLLTDVNSNTFVNPGAAWCFRV